MKVKALCGIIYNNVLYKCGDEIDVPRVMANTVIIAKEKSENELPESQEEEKLGELKKPSRKRGERNA